jgi:hypothetical protein
MSSTGGSSLRGKVLALLDLLSKALVDVALVKGGNEPALKYCVGWWDEGVGASIELRIQVCVRANWWFKMYPGPPGVQGASETWPSWVAAEPFFVVVWST